MYPRQASGVPLSVLRGGCRESVEYLRRRAVYHSTVLYVQNGYLQKHGAAGFAMLPLYASLILGMGDGLPPPRQRFL
jgi:hypothetical protein